MRVKLTNGSIAACTLLIFFLFNVSLSGSTPELNKPVGGVITTASNTNQCIGDNQVDIVQLELTGNVGDSSLYALTTDQGVIRVLQTHPDFDLTGADRGTYKLVHISYSEFTVAPRIGINIKKLKGWFDLSNYIMVNRVSPFSGYLRSNDPSTICVDDGTADRIEVLVSAQRGDHQGWVVANESGVIQQLVADGIFNLEGTGPGTLYIYHYASFGDQSVRVGQTINSLQGCIDFSFPYEIIKTINCVDPCDVLPYTVSFEPLTNDPVISTSICVDDDIPDTITVYSGTSTGSDNLQTKYLIINADGTILDISERAVISISHSDPTTCFIVSMSYETDLANCTVGNNISDIEGCYALSNFLEVTKETDCEPPACIVIGGTISVENDGATTVSVCVDDGLDDDLRIQLLNSRGPSIWVVLDTDGRILDVQNSPIFNFEGSPQGTCVIRHLSLTDPIIGLSIGENISDIEGCFSFSNSIFVNKLHDCSVPTCNVIGGIISASGQTEFSICVSDGEDDLIIPTVSNNVGTSNWVITDMSGTILMVAGDNMFNFEGSGAGVCQLWHVSIDETEEGLDAGANVSDVTGCVSFSNPITITREIDCGVSVCDVDGGRIATDSNETVITVCQTDDVDEIITVVLTDNVGPSTWIITDLNGLIISIQSNPFFSLDNFNLAACRIWHMSLRDPLIGFGIGRNVSDIQGCHDLSNSITVNKRTDCGTTQCTVQGGSISFGGITQFGYCVDDGLPDNLNVTLSGNAGNSSWVVTDTSGTILLIQNTSNFQFEGAEPGVCLIYHISFTDPLSGLAIGQNIDSISGCHDLSNPVVVTRDVNCGQPVCDVAGGTISVNGQTSLSICVDDEIDDRIDVSIAGQRGASIWVITDVNGNILLIQNSTSFNFEGVSAGVCQIWQMSFVDPLVGFSVGLNIGDVEGCYALSNSIEITREENCGTPVCDVLGGTISIDNTTGVTICLSDNESDLVSVDLAGNRGSSIWLVTDASGNIMMIQNEPNFDFANATAGVCYIWHMSLQDPITGFAVGANVSDLGGCFAISNSIIVTREDDCAVPVCNVTSGGISTNGTTSASVCLSDAESNTVSVDLTGNTGSSIWLVTDESGTILMIQNEPNFDFTNAGAGVCLIWHMSLQDPITGFAVGVNVSEIGGCYEISNSITVTRLVDCGAPVCNVTAGTIITADGATAASVCLEDGESNLVNVTLTGNTGSSIWLVTDASGNIMMIQNEPSFDFTNAGAGICYIWHMSLQDPITGFAVGANVSQIGGCFEISNSIAVTREVDCGAPSCNVTSGTISTNGVNDVSVCLSDSESNVVSVELTGNTGSSTWLVTDESGTILMIQNDPNFDFTNAGAGVCLIWHMSLQDPITGFAVGVNVSEISGCFDISNSIRVSRLVDCGAPSCNVTSGSISTEGATSVSVCLSDSESNVVRVDLTGNTGSSTWLVTDASGNIMMIQNDPVFNFTNAEAGVCYIWHMSLQDPIGGFAVGANVSQLSGCFAISNSIIVTRLDDCGPPPCDGIVGGTITTDTGSNGLTVCVDDGQAERIEILLSGNTGSSTWLITDSDGNIVDIQNTNIFSFEGAGAGVCYIYHLSLDNTLTGFTVGEPIANLSGCFQLSNRIQITREIDCGPDPCIAVGGNIVRTDGSTDVTFCVDDGISDVVDIELTDNVGPTTWLLTDGSGNILNIQSSPNFNFEGTEEGRCFIYHVSLQDPITGFTLDGNLSNIQGCFSLSNAISVNRVSNCGPDTCPVDGGIIMTSDSLTSITVCVTDGVNDAIGVQVNNFEGARLWVVTNNVGDITVIQAEDVFNFEGAGAGTCFIYNITIKDPISGFDIGENISAIQGCHDLSNPITVNRLADCNTGPIAAGGNITGPASATSVEFCVDDNLPDMITVTLTDNLGESTWVLTDSDGQILSVQASSTFNFEGTGAGVCQIWHLASFENPGGLQAGQNINNVTGNFSLSNQITVTRNVGCGPPPCDAVGGQITTVNNQVAVSVCVDDAVPDMVEVLLAGTTGSSSWVVSNEQGTILNIQTARTFDFSSAGSGVCFIRHISFIDDLSNFEIGQNVSSITGCYQLSNAIQVTREVGCAPLTCDDIRSGSISVMNGLTEITVCVDDGLQENIIGEITGNVGGSIWIVTDSLGVILGVENDAVFNFEGVNTGQCYIRHIGVLDPITGLIPGNNITDIMGCIQISNQVSVNRQLCSTEPCVVSGGAIMTSDSLTAITLCVDDNMSDMFSATVSGSTGISQWIITDSVGVVIGIQDGQNTNFDFESSGPGMCQVWHLSTRDSTFNIRMGVNASSFEGCFSLSNPITVTRLSGNCAMITCDDIDPGSISLEDSSQATTVCIDDGLDESLTIIQSGNIGAGLFVITDSQGIILDLENSAVLNFEGIEPGVCIVQYASLLDPFMGLIPGEALSAVTGCVKLSNTITVTRESCAVEVCEVNGGAITANGENESIAICVDDELADAIAFNVTGASGLSSWLITDTLGEIIDVFDGQELDFEGSDEGACLIWHLAARDSSFAVVVGQDANTLAGCFALSNSIRITKNVNCAIDSCSVLGGAITANSGDSSLSLCVDDQMPDLVDFTVTGASGVSRWLVTDTLGLIIDVFDGEELDFEGSDEGRCLIWHLAARDSSFTAQVGQNANALEGCFALSNSITLDKNVNCAVDTCAVTGGTIVTDSGLTELTICATDNISDAFDVIVSGSEGNFSIFAVTDTLGRILGFQLESVIDLEGSNAGVSDVYHISLRDSITGGELSQSIDSLKVCAAVSNPIRVTRLDNCGETTCDLMAPTLSLDGGAAGMTVCTDDNLAENLDISLLSGSGDSSIWLVTDMTGLILSLPEGPPFNFEGQAPGVCRVWNLTFSDAITGVAIGSNASDIAGCTALSNPIELTKINNCATMTCDAVPSTIALDNIQTVTTVCTDDEMMENLEVNLLNPGSGDSTLWLITDTLGIIITAEMSPPFNFEGVPPGVCLIWNLLYNGPISGTDVGADAGDIMGCTALSNPIRVNRINDCTTQTCETTAGIIRVGENETTTTVCVDDGLQENLDVILVGGSADSSLWVITDTSGLIVSLPTGLPLNFEGVAPGLCEIWNVMYTGTLTNLAVDSNIATVEGCYAISNSIKVSRQIECSDPNLCLVDAGFLSTSEGDTILTICAGDGFEDLITFNITGSTGSNQIFIATDTLGIIEHIIASDTFNFERLAAGVSFVYNLEFKDSLSNVINSLNIDQVEGCYALSNAVRITREDNCIDCRANGGSIVTEGGALTETLCVGDGQPDIVTATVSGESGESFVWLRTDTLGTIISRQENGSFEFDEAGPGVCQLWHMSMIGTVTGIVIGENVSGLDGCFSLSNPIRIERNFVDGGSVTTDSMQTQLTICVGDSIPNVLNFITTSTSTLTYTYIITDVNNRFLAKNDVGSIDIDGIGVGMCRIWGVSHTGSSNDRDNFIIGSQEDITANPIALCYELSEDFIQITRVEGDECPDGGSFKEDGGLSFVAMGNPVSDELILNIQSEFVEEKVWVDIRDVNGFLVYSKAMSMDIGEMTMNIDVSDLPNGLYYTTLRNSYNLDHQRIVIQR